MMAMRFNVAADTAWVVLSTEARYLGAAAKQLQAIERLEDMASHLPVDDHRIAEMSVEMYDQVLHVTISECDRLGAFVTNGSWCRLSINPEGRVAMTDSLDEERISILEPT